MLREHRLSKIEHVFLVLYFFVISWSSLISDIIAICLLILGFISLVTRTNTKFILNIYSYCITVFLLTTFLSVILSEYIVTALVGVSYLWKTLIPLAFFLLCKGENIELYLKILLYSLIIPLAAVIIKIFYPQIFFVYNVEKFILTR